MSAHGASGKPPGRILIAPNAYKGTLSAVRAAALIQKCVQARYPQASVDCCPVADGGDGTLEALQLTDPGFQRHTCVVMGPIPALQLNAEYLYHPARQLAVLEAAQAHGLVHLSSLAPMTSTSYGVGALMQHVWTHHPAVKTLVVTLGGSASTDGGMGALQALGFTFWDAQGQSLTSPMIGASLAEIARIERPTWQDFPQLLIATDVENVLLGPLGPAAVFAPQKGASPEQCQILEAGLQSLVRCWKSRNPHATETEPGTGAAGGLGYGLRQLANSQIVSGFDWLAAQQDLSERVARADWVITGEGRLDDTSLSGKGVGRLIELAGERPVGILAGSVQAGLSLPTNVCMVSMAEGMESVDAAMASPERAIELAMGALLQTVAEKA